MIDQIDEQLSAWVEQILGGIRPVLTAPKDTEGSLVINLYLLELVDDPLRRNTSRPPLQPALRYLVTAHADEPRDAHRLLSALLYAAFEQEAFEVELDPVPHNIWSAFKVAPRPSFILRVPLPHEWQPELVPIVREPATLRSTPLVTLHGRLLGPEQHPLANARIEIPTLYRYAYSDARGRFAIPGVPAAPLTKRLTITARDRTTAVQLVETGSEANPVVITFDLFHNMVGRLLSTTNGGRPIAGAEVACPAQLRYAISDDSGRFVLAGVPRADAYALTITVTAGAQARTFDETVTDAGSDQQPVEIRLAAD